MTKEFMLSKATEKYQKILDMYKNKNVKESDMFEELTCSIFAGDELSKEHNYVLKQDNTGGVSILYRGFEFELLECVNPFDDTTREEPIKLTSDKFICFCLGKHDMSTGKAYEECSDDEKDVFCRNTYLVTDAWCYGYPVDWDVEEFFIPKIDAWLDNQNINKL